ncbi:MAG: hypothetical protein ACFFEK_07360 [Candidatus Thorarchaeota archaeon]
MKKDELIESFRSFASIDFPEISDTLGEEITRILLQTRFLRVLMTRRRSEPDIISVDVELSFPFWMDSESHIDYSEQEVNSHQSELHEFLVAMIHHLEYLLRLRDDGFLLGLIGQGCVWTASKEYQTIPDSEDIDLLLSFEQ